MQLVGKYNFYNLLTETDQTKCIDLVNHFFDTDDWHRDCPPYQTYPDLFSYPEFYKFELSFIFSCCCYLNKKVTQYKTKSWCYMNFLNSQQKENREDLWHTHKDYELSGVYYLKNPKDVKNYELSGTEFLDDNIPNIIPEDFCWFIFPSNLLHRPGLIQSNKKRYVLAADFIPSN